MPRPFAAGSSTPKLSQLLGFRVSVGTKTKAQWRDLRFRFGSHAPTLAPRGISCARSSSVQRPVHLDCYAYGLKRPNPIQKAPGYAVLSFLTLSRSETAAVAMPSRAWQHLRNVWSWCKLKAFSTRPPPSIRDIRSWMSGVCKACWIELPDHRPKSI